MLLPWRSQTGGDSDLYQKMPGLSSSWKVADVRLEVEGQAVHISLEHDSESRFCMKKMNERLGKVRKKEYWA